ncbi:HAD hydrolase-like protein [Arthrobacter sp. ok362]|uniref:HAD hydrolase-like protein n=1 Tax=Arthrobacter sp. ok362 TaxID=1761745 RepID=UPI00088114B6|nr:HAD hydrolase-like protein [Arthrobacter sp. ok362]SDL21661.1 phosphoglycolate phosphatase [Arthrobacter sp. ok362]
MTHTTVPVIFDLDGTLVDPAGGITDGIAAALTELGLPVPGKSRMDAMIGPKLSHSLTEIAGVPAPLLEDAIRIYRAHYVSTGIAKSRLYPGIRGLLEDFVAAGRPLAVATQKPEGLARTVLAHHGIAGLFRSIRGSAADEAGPGADPVPGRSAPGGSAPEGSAPGGSAPEGSAPEGSAPGGSAPGGAVPEGKAGIVAAALSDLAVADPSTAGRAVMVGDRAQDVAGAAANGLDCIGVGWGFAPEGELHTAGAIEIVHNTTALHATINRLSERPGTTALNEVHTDGNV